MWSVWQAERNLYFNSFFVQAEGGNLVVDPLVLSAEDAREIEERGGVAWIAITNRDHERDARALAQRFGAKLITSELEAPLLSGAVDRTVRDGETFGGARVVALEGLKTPGEFALHFPEKSALLLGDALWGSPAGALRLMPDEKLADPPRAVLSLRKLRALLPEHLLVGDGACIFGGAHRAIWATLEARTDVCVNRINADELPWKSWDQEPLEYGARSREVGDHIGAEKLGYRIVELLPSQATCPLHWHAGEEELFVVLSGRPLLVAPSGEWPLRAGDYLCFPTRAAGAHKIVNRSAEPSELLLISNVDPGDVCLYPDSKKILVECVGLMLRSEPELDYWDGE